MSVNPAVPERPAPTGGVDWASDNHAVCVVDNDGEALHRLTVAHTTAGLRAMTDLLARHRVDAVAIERPDGPVVDARLATAPRGATASHAQALAGITAAFLAALTAISEQIQALAKQITEALHAHPDRDIFTSLPKAGTVRAARLLAEIGDARGRFPTPSSLACLAGVAPSTRQSGKTRVVSFRWAVDKQLRDAICDFAGDSRHANPWAADLNNRARASGLDHPHAVRILARSWLNIIWKCWTTNTAYNTDRHGALQHLTKPGETTKIMKMA